MTQRRWLRIIPVALIMYTISYVDRTNISLALDPNISRMMGELGMNDSLKGEAAGIFFFGYVLLQVPAGYWAARWSPRKLISIFLICWGICAVACGMARTFREFEVARFFLGVAESGVYPATLVLLANWFPRSERARATAYWNLCQPLAVAASAPFTGWLLGAYGWRTMIILEGALPFIWLPIWWFFVRDHPREAKWCSAEEREHLETVIRAETSGLAAAAHVPTWRRLCHPTIGVMLVMYFLHNCQAYGCMTFFTGTLKGRGFSPLQYGLLFSVPYVVTAVSMVLTSRSSDRTGERRGHVAFVYIVSGVCLVLSVLARGEFWLSYALMCLAIPGPFAALAPFWAIPSETMPRHLLGVVVGFVNAIGNVGGFFGPKFIGWLADKYHSTAVPYIVLGVGLAVAGCMAYLLPKSVRRT